MEKLPEDLLFVKDDRDKTTYTYESAVNKFGIKKVFQTIEECVPSHVLIISM
jgi:hypothetical protein